MRENTVLTEKFYASKLSEEKRAILELIIFLGDPKKDVAKQNVIKAIKKAA